MVLNLPSKVQACQTISVRVRRRIEEVALLVLLPPGWRYAVKEAFQPISIRASFFNITSRQRTIWGNVDCFSLLDRLVGMKEAFVEVGGCCFWLLNGIKEARRLFHISFGLAEVIEPLGSMVHICL